MVSGNKTREEELKAQVQELQSQVQSLQRRNHKLTKTNTKLTSKVSRYRQQLHQFPQKHSFQSVGIQTDFRALKEKDKSKTSTLSAFKSLREEVMRLSSALHTLTTSTADSRKLISSSFHTQEHVKFAENRPFYQSEVSQFQTQSDGKKPEFRMKIESKSNIGPDKPGRESEGKEENSVLYR